jgi:hypothetical protein
VTNKFPSIIRQEPGFDLTGIRVGLGEAARTAFMKAKKDPQMVLVIMPVSPAARYVGYRS